jgi:hypothetical protein
MAREYDAPEYHGQPSARAISLVGELEDRFKGRIMALES